MTALEIEDAIFYDLELKKSYLNTKNYSEIKYIEEEEEIIEKTFKKKNSNSRNWNFQTFFKMFSN